MRRVARKPFGKPKPQRKKEKRRTTNKITSERPSVSRVRENRKHGLKGGFSSLVLEVVRDKRAGSTKVFELWTRAVPGHNKAKSQIKKKPKYMSKRVPMVSFKIRIALMWSRPRKGLRRWVIPKIHGGKWLDLICTGVP